MTPCRDDAELPPALLFRVRECGKGSPVVAAVVIVAVVVVAVVVVGVEAVAELGPMLDRRCS